MAASDYLTLGRGEVLFAPFAVGTKVAGAYKYLGNCPTFNLNVAVSSLEHMDSRAGINEEDLSVVTDRKISGSITCDDMKPDNQAFFFLGSASALTVSATAGKTDTFNAVEIGGVYQVGVDATNPVGVRALATVVVKVATTTMTIGTDYTVDILRGLLTIVGGAISAGDNVTITYGTSASTRNQVVSGQKQIEGALLFKATNPAGKDVDYRLPYVQLRPEGDLQMIGADWRSMNLSIKAMTLGANAAVYADDQAVV